MGRSIRLGHCVCDPRKPCPCPLFREKDVCTCAGERVPAESGGRPARLTDFVRSAGCASKISQKELHRVLEMLPTVEDPRLLVGMATADDAGVFRLTDGVTLVQTVDVFTPGVDDPYLFGRIAACNSLSDVYAMGGHPVTALSIIGFPIDSLPHDVMAAILRGGMDALKEADTVLLGGHSIQDEEVKFGLAVTGTIRRDELVTNAGARPGDVLILTKPLGTGIVSLANQIGKASPSALRAATDSMATLNRAAAEVMRRCRANACTDVTGFGLLGHLCRMAIESGVTAEIWCEALPLLPGVREYAEQGMYSGANERNAEFSAERTDFEEGIGEVDRAVLFDPQTSGGLLMAVAADRAVEAVEAMREAGMQGAAAVGRIANASDGRIVVRRLRPGAPGGRPGFADQRPETGGGTTVDKKADEAECCGDGGGASKDAIGDFQSLLGKSLRPGVVDAVTKELVAVGMALAVQCEPCLRVHIRKALGMGIGRDEIEEIAAIAMGFGGCRTLMLWNQVKKELLAT